jgi:hypothetical protein
MIDNSIDNFFKIINFIINCCLLLYIVYRYIVPAIVRAIASYKDKALLAYQVQELIRQKSVHIEQACIEQEAVYDELQNKFKIWQAHVDLQANLQAEQHERYQVNMMVNQERRKVCERQRYILKYELPTIVEQLRSQLLREYHLNVEKNNSYIDGIVDVLERK